MNLSNKDNLSLINLIFKKKEGIALDKSDFTFFVLCLKKGINDLEIGAFISALDIKGINEEEIKFFIESLHENGIKTNELEFYNNKKYVIDYIAISEFNDSLDLLLGPLISGFDLQYSLVYDGGNGIVGTVFNKLDSIGVGYNFSFNHINSIIEDCGMFISKQSKVVPIFEKLNNVLDSLQIQNPYLKLSLILAYKFKFSKILTIINLKFGELGIVKTVQAARKISQLILNLANYFNKKVIIIITNADSFIGKHIGTALEIKKISDFFMNDKKFIDLNNQIKKIFSEICYRLNLILDKSKVNSIIDDLIFNKKALNSFNRFLAKQRGRNLIKYNNYRIHKYFSPKYSYEIKSSREGYLYFKKYVLFKELAFALNIYKKNGSKIDYQAGIYFDKNVGEYIKKDDLVVKIYSSYKLDSKWIEEMTNNIIVYERREDITIRNYTQDIYDNLNLIKVIRNEN